MTAVDNTSVSVTWLHPYDYAGEILGYKVRVSTVKDDEEIAYLYFPATSTEALIPNLYPGTAYSGRVASSIKQTMQGDGETQSTFIFMGEATTLGIAPGKYSCILAKHKSAQWVGMHLLRKYWHPLLSSPLIGIQIK